MSWNVGDPDWLAEPTSSSGAGPIDAVDEQVVAALGTSPTPPHSDLPPPPPSATFEQHERPSYESGAFVADPPAVEAPAAPSTSEAATSGAESPEFHIPALAFGVAAPPAERDDGPPATSSAASPPSPDTSPPPAVTSPSSEAPEGLVIPTLSRMKWVPAPPPSDPSADASVAAAVYDEEPAAEPPPHEPGLPEVLEQVDSSELELVASDEEVEPDEPEHEEVAFVIPTLARADDAPASEQPAVAPDVVIPTLTRLGPQIGADAEVIPPKPTPPEVAPADAEELEEVEAEAIESIDATDLVEAEAEAEVEPEVPPPAPEAEESKPRVQPPEAKPQQKRRKAWYDDVFAEHFTFLFPQTWEETAQRDAQFVYDQLGLSDDASVLDVGCGDGRHAIELAKLGLNVTGIDNSLAMLLAAAAHKEGSGVEDDRVTFIHGDMRRLPRDREFDAVMCVGTTLGYFEEEQNRQCLQEMVDRLAPHGRLLLHVFNRDFVAPHLPSRSWWQGRRCMVIDEAEMNFFANRLRVHRTIIFDDGRQYEHFMFMRAYTVQDLGKAMSALGLRVVEVSGSRDTRGRFYGSASPDIWILAERK